MSASSYAVTPETYTAWRYLELTDELRPQDGERAEMIRGNEELELLLAELQKSPTIENVERFFKQGLELQCFTQRSLARSLERYHCQKICIADLEARPGAYPCFGTEEEARKRANTMRQNHANLAPMVAEIEEGQRSRAQHEGLLATLNTLIARRHAGELFHESELSCIHR